MTVLVASLVAVVGAGLSAGAGAALRTAQQHAADEAADRRMDLVREAVAAETTRYVDTLRVVAAAAGAADALTHAGFTRTVRPLEQMRLAGATSIAFMVPATDEQIPRVQELWRGRGVPDLVLDTADTRHEHEHEHIFSVFSHSLDGVTTPAIGIDLTRAPAPAQALVEARRSGQVTVSDPYRLIRDAHLPVRQRQLSFVLTAPVYGPAPAAGTPRPFRGWMLMGLRGQDFVGATLHRLTRDAADVRLRAHHSDGTDVTVATLRAAAGRRPLHRTGQVRVAQRQWILDLDVVGARPPGAGGVLPAAVAGSGIALSALLAVSILTLTGGRARARVAEATAELSAAEESARRRATLLSAVLDSVGEGVGVVDEHGAFLLHNPAAKTLLGIEPDSDRISSWQSHYGIFTPDGAAPFPTGRLPLVRALAGEHVEQVPMMIRNAARPDGVIISVSARPLDLAAGQPGAVAVFHDVTARARADARLAEAAVALQDELARHEADQADLRAARDELAAQKAYLTQLLDAINVSVITCDTDGALVHANRIARAALPYDGKPLTIGEATLQLRMTYPDGTPIPVEEAPMARALRGERVDDLEAVVTGPDGVERVIMLHARPLRHPDGHITGGVVSSFTITALREREAELTAFAGVVAHDLKRPLSAVRGFTDLVHENLSDQAGQEENVRHLDRALAATKRMSRLIDDLLAYATARDATLTPVTVGLNKLVREVVDEHLTAAAADPSMSASQVYIGPLPAVCADLPLIRQLLDNLIGNAIKYTPPGRAAHVDITAAPTGDGRIRVEIADRGIGIPPGEHQAIFTGFHRVATAYSGTGLGLAICKRVVERHGGTITATDNPGGGARFAFTLPAGVPGRPKHSGGPGDAQAK
ncbi:hypothetical protein GCM10018955_59200 [Planomonospora venezuelensis]